MSFLAAMPAQRVVHLDRVRRGAALRRPVRRRGALIGRGRQVARARRLGAVVVADDARAEHDRGERDGDTQSAPVAPRGARRLIVPEPASPPPLPHGLPRIGVNAVFGADWAEPVRAPRPRRAAPRPPRPPPRRGRRRARRGRSRSSARRSRGPAAGCGANAGPSSSTRPPCAPTPGSRKIGVRHQLAEAAEVLGPGGARDSAHEREPAFAARSSRPARGRSSPAARAAAGRPRPGAPRRPAFEVRTSTKQPAHAADGGADQRLERVAAEQRVRGERVHPEARARFRTGPASRRRTPARRRSTVTGTSPRLPSPEHEQAVVVHDRHDLLERRPSPARRAARSRRAAASRRRTPGPAATIAARQCSVTASAVRMRARCGASEPRRRRDRAPPATARPGRGRARARRDCGAPPRAPPAGRRNAAASSPRQSRTQPRVTTASRRS